MKRVSFAVAVAVMLGCSAGALSLGGCGEPPKHAKTAKVAVGSMPADATFKGVWFNPVFGELHMLTEGNTVSGKYKSQSSGIWGIIHGTITGDVVHFEWEEHKTGAIGPGSKRQGKGYWKYVPSEPPEQPKLKGEWGFAENEVGGGDWDSVKQKDVEPKPDTIGGDPDPTVDSGWDATPAPKKK
jgi:hypothetical protein